MENDPGESINLYDQETVVVNELKSLYKKMEKSTMKLKILMTLAIGNTVKLSTLKKFYNKIDVLPQMVYPNTEGNSDNGDVAIYVQVFNGLKKFRFLR